MIRTFVKPTQSNYTVVLNLPKDYIGQEIEIIAFKKEEGLMKGASVDITKPTKKKSKSKTISKEKTLLIKEIKQAVEEMKLIRAGKLKGTPAKQLLDEL